jgi:hypothetical protein
VFEVAEDQGEWRHYVQEKGQDFILGRFYVILNLEMGRRAVSNGL